MDDLSPNETIGGWPRQAPVYHIKTKDNLYVGISTQDQDLSKISHPTSTGAQPGMGYESPSSTTINGNIVDADGNITLPMLGKIPASRGTKTYSLNLNSKSALMSDGYYLLPDDVVILEPGKNNGLQQKLPAVGIVVGSLSALLLLNYLK